MHAVIGKRHSRDFDAGLRKYFSATSINSTLSSRCRDLGHYWHPDRHYLTRAVAAVAGDNPTTQGFASSALSNPMAGGRPRLWSTVRNW